MGRWLVGGMLDGMQFTDFDTRGYRTVDVRTGYARWVGSYEDTVADAMDIALLDELSTVDWSHVRRAVDLGCGTGRTGAWLRGREVPHVDGVDLTPEMLELAGRRGAHDRLFEADVTATGLPGGEYDLVISSLVDEHLDALAPLYAEAYRLAAEGASFVLVAFHPHFIMHTGMPTPASYMKCFGLAQVGPPNRPIRPPGSGHGILASGQHPTPRQRDWIQPDGVEPDPPATQPGCFQHPGPNQAVVVLPAHHRKARASTGAVECRPRDRVNLAPTIV